MNEIHVDAHRGAFHGIFGPAQEMENRLQALPKCKSIGDEKRTAYDSVIIRPFAQQAVEQKEELYLAVVFRFHEMAKPVNKLLASFLLPLKKQDPPPMADIQEEDPKCCVITNAPEPLIPDEAAAPQKKEDEELMEITPAIFKKKLPCEEERPPTAFSLVEAEHKSSLGTTISSSSHSLQASFSSVSSTASPHSDDLMECDTPVAGSAARGKGLTEISSDDEENLSSRSPTIAVNQSAISISVDTAHRSVVNGLKTDDETTLNFSGMPKQNQAQNQPCTDSGSRSSERHEGEQVNEDAAVQQETTMQALPKVRSNTAELLLEEPSQSTEMNAGPSLSGLFATDDEEVTESPVPSDHRLHPCSSSSSASTNAKESEAVDEAVEAVAMAVDDEERPENYSHDDEKDDVEANVADGSGSQASSVERAEDLQHQQSIRKDEPEVENCILSTYGAGEDGNNIGEEDTSNEADEECIDIATTRFKSKLPSEEDPPAIEEGKVEIMIKAIASRESDGPSSTEIQADGRVSSGGPHSPSASPPHAFVSPTVFTLESENNAPFGALVPPSSIDSISISDYSEMSDCSEMEIESWSSGPPPGYVLNIAVECDKE